METETEDMGVGYLLIPHFPSSLQQRIMKTRQDGRRTFIVLYSSDVIVVFFSNTISEMHTYFER